MSTITKTIGSRIRAYRKQAGWSQEQLAEKANLHFTYIGQVERGEKSLTIVSLEKILSALDISFPDFFEALDAKSGKTSYATQCYDLVAGRNSQEQETLYRILSEISQLMGPSFPGKKE